MAHPYDEIVALPFSSSHECIKTARVKNFEERVVVVDKHANAKLDLAAFRNFDFPKVVKNLATGPDLNASLTPENFGSEMTSKKNFTILMWLCSRPLEGSTEDHLLLLEYLLVNGASTRYMEMSCGLLPLHFAVVNQTFGFIEHFLDISTGLHPDIRSGCGDTALMLASARGRRDVMQLLIRRGADPTTADREGRNALMSAAENGHYFACQDLIRVGACINKKSHEGLTAKDYHLKKFPRPMVSFLKLLTGEGGSKKGSVKSMWW